MYDPFVPGRHGVLSRTFEARDVRRGQSFPCEVWRPTKGDDAHGAVAVRPLPAVVYSHYSGGNRRVATFLTMHLASHGYVVAALDHSEVVSARLQPRKGETTEERDARVQGWVDNRVPDIGFLLDAVVPAEAGGSGPVGIVATASAAGLHWRRRCRRAHRRGGGAGAGGQFDPSLGDHPGAGVVPS